MKNNLTSNLANVFVGRTQELNKLRSCLKKAKDGFGGFIIVSGEAGIGKSTLVRQFTTEADAKTISTSFDGVRSFEPYSPFLRIIENLGSSKIQKSLGIGAAEKEFNVLNANSAKYNDFLEMEFLYSVQNEKGIAQQRLLSTLLEASRNNNLLISIEDAHLAPLTAWRFIHYLCESITEYNILIVATLRQDGREVQSTRKPAYSDVLQRMNREGLVEKIELDRFGKQNIRKLLHKIYQRSDFSSHFIPCVKEITGGIPEQIVKFLAKMQQEGVIFQQNSVWFNQENISKDAIINIFSDEHEMELVSEQVKELSPNHLKLLKYASLMNGPFNHDQLTAIMKRPKIQVLKDLLTLKQNKFLTQIGEENYQFKRTAIRTTILEKILNDEKSAMHLEIATGIETRAHIDPTEKIYLLAYHYDQTEDYESAFQYQWQASNLAIKNFAFLEAKDYIGNSLKLRTEISEKKYRVEILQLLIWAAWLDRILGYWDESVEHCNTALAFTTHETNLRIKNQILLQHGLTYFRINDWQKAQVCFEQCLSNRQNLSDFDKAMVNYGLGNVHFELANFEQCYQYYDEALILAQEIDAKQLMANIINNLGAVENVQGYRMRAIAQYSKSIPLYKSIGDDFGLARVYHNIGMTHADENNWEQANEFYGKSLAVSDVMGLTPLKSITFLNRALALAHLQKLDEAKEYNFKANRILIRLKDELGMAEYHKIQGIIERKQSNWTEACNNLQKAQEKFMSLGNKLGSAETEYELGLLALDMGKCDDAILWLNKALTSYSELKIIAKVKLIEKELKKINSSTSPSPAKDYEFEVDYEQR